MQSDVSKMVIGIASGKGGTGKTTFSVALANAQEENVVLLDCDVEEPNANIFLQPEVLSTQDVKVKIPEIDNDSCSSCRACADFCEYNAITSLPGVTLVFPELCHNCGGCVKLCPDNAITEKDFIIGETEIGQSGNIKTVQGKMQIGKAMSPPIIHAVKQHVSQTALTIIDCPPGTSCPMIAAVKGVDYTILVTEPTPFGLHDLTIAVDTMKQLDIPFGVVINRADSGDARVLDYCRNNHVPVLLEIKTSRKVAEAYSQGKTILDAMPELKMELNRILEVIKHQIKGSQQ